MLSVLLIIEQSVNKSVWTSCLKASRGIGLSKLNIFRFHQAKRLKEPSRGFDNLKRNISGAGGNRHRTLFAFTKRSDWKNPRPNRETIRFLHAYSGLHFRAAARPGPPTDALFPKVSSPHRDLRGLFPIFPAPLDQPDSEQHPVERCLVPSPGDGIKPVIYYASIRQRERNCFRQLNCRPNGLWSIQPSLRMLTYHLDPLSNPVSPSEFFSSENEVVVAKDGSACAKSV